MPLRWTYRPGWYPDEPRPAHHTDDLMEAMWQSYLYVMNVTDFVDLTDNKTGTTIRLDVHDFHHIEHLSRGRSP